MTIDCIKIRIINNIFETYFQYYILFLKMKEINLEVPQVEEIGEVCNDLDIQPSDCVLYGITDKNHKKFGDYDRGSRWRRVCISSLLGDMCE